LSEALKEVLEGGAIALEACNNNLPSGLAIWRLRQELSCDLVRRPAFKKPCTMRASKHHERLRYDMDIFAVLEYPSACPRTRNDVIGDDFTGFGKCWIAHLADVAASPAD
jgi:hypothetical protein